MGATELVEPEYDLNLEVAYWIDQVEKELREIDRQQYKLVRERTKFEGSLRWLQGLLENNA